MVSTPIGGAKTIPPTYLRRVRLLGRFGYAILIGISSSQATRSCASDGCEQIANAVSLLPYTG